MGDKTARWYCHAEDELTDCMGRTPHLYDPDEWDHEHDACGWVRIETTRSDPYQYVHEDWRKTQERKTRGD